MAEQTSKVRLIFDGIERGVVAAARKSERAVKSLGDENSRLSKTTAAAEKSLLGVGKGLLAIGGANSAVSVIGGTVGVLTQLAPAALVLPGALLSGAAAMTTFKIATKGFGEAVGAGLSGDMEAFAEATKKMHPEMAKAAAEVVKFRPEIDKLKRDVQGEFWDGFSGQIAKLGKTYLPILDDGLSAISRSLGGVAFKATQAAESNFFQEDVTQILDNTSAALDNVDDAVGNVLSGFVGLGGVGSTYLPRLGAAVDKVAAKFKAWVDSGVEDGSIKRMIDGALKGFRDLGGIVKNVGSTIGSIFRGLGVDMSSPLARIRELTGQVAEFMKTASAQDGLRALGETLRVVGEVVGRVVMTALKELMPTLVKVAPVAQEVARTLGDLLVGALETVGPLIRGVADVLNAFPGSAGAATVAVVGFVAAVKTVQTVSAVSTAVSTLGTTIAGIGDKAKTADGKVAPLVGRLGKLKALGGAAAVGAVAVAMDEVNTSAAGGEQNLSGWGENLHDIVGAGGQIAAFDFAGIFRDIGDELTVMNSKWDEGNAPIQRWAATVKQSFQEDFLNVFAALPGQVGGFLSSMGATVGAKFSEIVGYARSLPGQVGGALSGLGGTLSGVASGALAAFTGAVRGGASAALGVVRAIPGQVSGALSSLGGLLSGVASRAGAAFTGTIRSGLATAVAVARGIPGQIAGALGNVGGILANAGRALINGLTAGMRSALSSALAFARSIAGQIAAVKGPIPKDRKTLVPAGEALMYGLREGMRSGLDDVLARTSAVAGSIGATVGAPSPSPMGNPFAGAVAGGPSPMAAPAAAAMQPAARAAAPSSGGAQVTFAGNTSDALATVIMGMVRTGKIQIKAA